MLEVYFGIDKSSIMWTLQNNKLTRTFVFPDFDTAFSFMAEVAGLAKEMNHHPRWTNVYNKVEMELSTHDANNTVTQKDYKLAEGIDLIWKRYQL